MPQAGLTLNSPSDDMKRIAWRKTEKNTTSVALSKLVAWIAKAFALSANEKDELTMGAILSD